MPLFSTWTFMKRFFLIFCGLLLLLFTLELLNPIQRLVIIPWTSALANLCGAIAGAFDGNVISQGKLLLNRGTGGGVSIEAGCNGVEACLILVAAMLAYPSAWRFKLVGILCGGLAVQLVNVVRVISLFYLAGWNTDVFEFAHRYLWQALIMLDVLVVWLVWIRQVARRDLREVAPNV